MTKILIMILMFYISQVVLLEDKEILFENSYVKCFSDSLIIKYYYFPFGNKRIEYKNILSMKLFQKTDLNYFEVKCWGMAFSPIWWHLDIRRNWRQYYIIFDVNQWPKIGLTMDDKDTIKVYDFIKKKEKN